MRFFIKKQKHTQDRINTKFECVFFFFNLCYIFFPIQNIFPLQYDKQKNLVRAKIKLSVANKPYNASFLRYASLRYAVCSPQGRLAYARQLIGEEVILSALSKIYLKCSESSESGTKSRSSFHS